MSSLTTSSKQKSNTLKRSNSESLSGPAAKRSSKKESQQEMLLKAQAACDRLDFTSAQRICTEIIDSSRFESVEALLIRSISFEKRGMLQEAAQDVEALELEKNVKTRLRAAEVYLALALNQTTLAQKDDSEDVDYSYFSVPSKKLRTMRKNIEEAREVNRRNPFERLSPEIFTRIFSGLDAPDIGVASTICSKWRETILEDQETFRTFRMEGEESKVAEGLELFNRRCHNSMVEIELEFEDKFEPNHSFVRLAGAIASSNETLKIFTVRHFGELETFIISEASKMPNLRVLKSILLDGVEKHLPTPSIFAPLLRLPQDWPARLDILEWVNRKSLFQVDYELAALLVKAKEVRLSSLETHTSFVVKLLSTAPELQEVDIQNISSSEPPTSIPSMNLIHLKHLSLSIAPRLRNETSSFTFFQKIQCPQIISLSLGEADLEVLPLLDFGPELIKFKVKTMTGTFKKIQEVERQAQSVLEAFKKWEKLQHLSLEMVETDVDNDPDEVPITYQSQVSKSFWNHFIVGLIPFSRVSLRTSSEVDPIILPNLSHLQLGSLDLLWKEAHPGELNCGLALACLVASRRAAFEGKPLVSVLAAANGYLSLELDNQSSQTSQVKINSALTTLDIYTPLVTDSKSLDYLEENTSDDSYLYQLKSLPLTGPPSEVSTDDDEDEDED